MKPPNRRPYLVFRDEQHNTVGLTGPYTDTQAATAAMNTLITADAEAMAGLILRDVPPEALCIYAPYHHIEVADLSPAEIEALAPGHASTG